MSCLQTYLSALKADHSSSVLKTVQELQSKLSEVSNQQYVTALLLGNVQSGKTSHMLGCISALADKGYKLFIILTSDNIDLQRQTFNRAKNNLESFSVLSENETYLFKPQNLSKPILLVLKKNANVLKKWGNIFASSISKLGLFLCIFDDEADSASLNTLVNKNQTSTINKSIEKIRNCAVSTLFFEVTATPQALLLQSTKSNWRPDFTIYFPPGADYIGGKFFYSIPASYCIKFTQENELDDISEDEDIVCPIGMQKSIMTFLVICAYKKMKGDQNCNFLIHPSVRISIQKKFVECVTAQLTLLQQSSNDPGFDEQLIEVWQDLQQTKPDFPHYEDLKKTIIDILDNTLICVIPLNSQSTISRNPSDPDALKVDKGFNIFVGGNSLGRGITFPNLQVVYYCRTSKSPLADTFWQHSRVFGYDREKELVRIYIPKSIHQLFVNLSASNEILIKQIQNDAKNVEVIYPKNIKPTRKNVLDNNYLNMIVGGVNIFDFSPSGKNTINLDAILEKYFKLNVADVDVADFTTILSYLDTPTFNTEKYVSCILALCEKRPSVKFKLIVRINRDIGKGTGTLLSPTDRDLGEIYNTDVVLTLYRIVGSTQKGWDGQPLWIPNIKFPEGLCFYDIE